MPQATDELRAQWDGPDDSKARTYLAQRGFRLTESWEWIPPKGQEVTDEDLSAIDFMVQEWDFGGLKQFSEVDNPATTDREIVYCGGKPEPRKLPPPVLVRVTRADRMRVAELLRREKD